MYSCVHRPPHAPSPSWCASRNAFLVLLSPRTSVQRAAPRRPGRRDERVVERRQVGQRRHPAARARARPAHFAPPSDAAAGGQIRGSGPRRPEPTASRRTEGRQRCDGTFARGGIRCDALVRRADHRTRPLAANAQAHVHALCSRFTAGADAEAGPGAQRRRRRGRRHGRSRAHARLRHAAPPVSETGRLPQLRGGIRLLHAHAAAGARSGDFDVDASQIVPITSATLRDDSHPIRPAIDGGGDVQLNPHGLVDGEQAALLNTTTDVLAHARRCRTPICTPTASTSTPTCRRAPPRAPPATATPGDGLAPVAEPNRRDRRPAAKALHRARMRGRHPRRDRHRVVRGHRGDAVAARRADPRHAATPTGYRPHRSAAGRLHVQPGRQERKGSAGRLPRGARSSNPGRWGGRRRHEALFDDRTPEPLRASIGRVALVYPREVCPFLTWTATSTSRRRGPLHRRPAADLVARSHRPPAPTARPPTGRGCGARACPAPVDYAVENAFRASPTTPPCWTSSARRAAARHAAEHSPRHASEAERLALEHNVNGFHKEQRLYPMPPALVKALLAVIEKASRTSFRCSCGCAARATRRC